MGTLQQVIKRGNGKSPVTGGLYWEHQQCWIFRWFLQCLMEGKSSFSTSPNSTLNATVDGRRNHHLTAGKHPTIYGIPTIVVQDFAGPSTVSTTISPISGRLLWRRSPWREGRGPAPAVMWYAHPKQGHRCQGLMSSVNSWYDVNRHLFGLYYGLYTGYILNIHVCLRILLSKQVCVHI